MSRIIVHDYGAFGFPVELSRTLAARGHEVLHLHAAGFRVARGGLENNADDPPGFTIEALTLDEASQQHTFVRRLFQERRYGTVLASRITAFRPDVVISANTPLEAQVRAVASSGRAGAAFIFWVQDLYSVAVARILKRRLPLLGRLIGARYEALERRILDASDEVIAITADFLPTLTSWRVPPDRITVIENWASLTDVRPAAKVNPWSKAHGLEHQAVFLYAGTLGRKHDPGLLVALAEAVPESRVVVIAEGAGANWLARRANAVQNLVLLPLQPPDTISDVLASADVLVALLEPDAGAFSVPSKVLSYLTAGRPILGSMPLDNLAARTIIGAGAGRVAAAGDSASFLAAARDLLFDEDARAAAGSSGRAYALAKFDIESIADRFEAIIRRCTANTSEPYRRTRQASKL